VQTTLCHSDQPFEIVSDFIPSGDQPAAIDRLTANIEAGVREQVLLGVTGSGKTFTMAHVVQRMQRPTQVVAPKRSWRRSFSASSAYSFPSYLGQATLCIEDNAGKKPLKTWPVPC
jgi:excinuclease ABC subunit B